MDAGAAVADGDVETVIEEVEVDLEDPVAEGDGAGGQPAGGDREGDLPPLVEEGHQLQLDLAHDLGPHVQGVQRVLPRRHTAAPARSRLLGPVTVTAVPPLVVGELSPANGTTATMVISRRTGR